jgi:FkbM family methyltransferase
MAYEADPATYEILVGMLAKTGLKVNAVHAAIWTYTGEIQFIGSGHEDKGRLCRCGLIQAPGQDTSHLPKFERPEISTVPRMSFTEALGDTVWDFVKMDIEGAEHEVLMGTKSEVLRDHIKRMHVEFHSEWPTSEALYWEVRNKIWSIFDEQGPYLVNKGAI